MKTKLLIEKETNLVVLLIDIDGNIFAYHKKNSSTTKSWVQGLKISLNGFCSDKKVKGDAHKHYMFENNKSFNSIDEALKSTKHKLSKYSSWRKLWQKMKM